jgi:hypothetical protein
MALFESNMELEKYFLLTVAGIICAALGALSVATDSLVIAGGLHLLGVLSRGTAGALMVVMLAVGALCGLGVYVVGVLLE